MQLWNSVKLQNNTACVNGVQVDIRVRSSDMVPSIWGKHSRQFWDIFLWNFGRTAGSELRTEHTIMILKQLEYFLLQSFIFLVVHAGFNEKALPEPTDLSLTWMNEFSIKLEWSPSTDSDASCKVTYWVRTPEKEAYTNSSFIVLDVFVKDAVTITVQTKPIICGDRTISKPVSITIDNPTELVKKFQCSLYSTKDMNCTWLPANQAPLDLKLYYRYAGEHSSIAACSEYQYRTGQKTGCHLRGNLTNHNIDIQVNGTINGLSVRNTFSVIPINNVKTLASKVNIKEEGKNLLLSWEPPSDFKPSCWDYILNYSKCDESLSKILSKQSTEKIPYDRRCQYRVRVKAMYTDRCGNGGSDWSEEEIHGEDDWSLTLVAIIIPASVFVFVVLFICCVMKYKEIIFPKIPQPFFKEMLDISKEHMSLKTTVYVPVVEKVEENISLQFNPSYPINQPES
ncbi:hypothetical protein UPYG_G00239530 [Umbra pygmaea]|uniref:Type I cytokine receptor cytokine-binding domain-containing protein n=1 Tax=Umbra pygmaea TaxID=75934 RepID=A0ABD0WXA0_UMBPY